MRKLMVGVLAAAFVVLAVPGSAQATGGESTWGTGYGQIEVKAWHCPMFLKAFPWRGETILSQRRPGRYMDWIQNEVTVTVHGASFPSLTISKRPKATITFNKKNTAKVRWKRFVANHVINSGQVYAGYGSTYVSVKSCGAGNGPGHYGNWSRKCVYAGAV